MDSGPKATENAIKTLCRIVELRENQFTAFRQFFHEVQPELEYVKRGSEATYPIEGIGPRTYFNVMQAVERLRSSPNVTAERFWTESFPLYTQESQRYASRQIVKLAYMIDPMSQDSYPNGFNFENEPIYPVKWQPGQKFKEFFDTAFPTDAHDVWTASSKHMSLKAWKLHQRLKLIIVRTDDLAEHLVYNPKTKSLAVFHQVEWLKAQIQHVKERKLDEDVEVSLAA